MTRGREEALQDAVRRGALTPYRPELERGEQYLRRLWVTAEVSALFKHGVLVNTQRSAVTAAFRRFVTGGPYTVVTRDCRWPEPAGLGDIRELKGPLRSPPFIEVRFKPPRNHLRVFGRFVAQDGLVLLTTAEKWEGKNLSVPKQRSRCDEFFSVEGLNLAWVPLTIQESISNAKFA